MSRRVGLSDSLQRIALDRQCWEMHQAWKLTLVNPAKAGPCRICRREQRQRSQETASQLVRFNNYGSGFAHPGFELSS